MKKQMLFSVLGVLAMGFTSCGGLPEAGSTPGNEEPVSVSDAVRYVQDGQALSSEAVRALEAKHGALYFLMDSDSSGAVAQVFTQKADLEQAKAEMKSQTVCIPAQLITVVYDLPTFAGASLSMAPGASIPNLAAVPQVGGGNWDNDISSIRAADCVWTYVYEFPNFLGNFVAIRGNNLAVLPGLYNNSTSSIRVVP